jgi:multidrug efflux pump subunit AcrA (membrane-fusion protein)
MKTMNRSFAWCVMAAALAVPSLTARAAWAQDAGQPPAPVTVAPVVKGSTATTVSATGTVVSRNDARLAAEVAGRLDWVAEPGAKVAKGAPLARVDARAL